MAKFQLGDTAILKPYGFPVTILGPSADGYEIQHAVDPDELVTKDNVLYFDGVPVVIISDGEFEVVIEYAVAADRLVEEDLNDTDSFDA